MSDGYTGRFAPSPTGPLHFGSLIAALASYLAARSRGGRWIVRMEDLDRPREVAGAADDILRTLERLGLHWDGPIMYQSQRNDAYRDALNRLTEQGLIFPCSCTRKAIIAAGLRAADGALVYPGTCRKGLTDDQSARTQRIRVAQDNIAFHDRVQGQVSQRLDQDVGDFVLVRADGLFAYQLAVVVDDADQGITDILRGVDLMPSTPRQIYLQQNLGLITPGYAHIPVATGAHGNKLSKQTFAPAIEQSTDARLIECALDFLGQSLPSPRIDSTNELIQWAVEHWNETAIPAVTEILAPSEYR